MRKKVIPENKFNDVVENYYKEVQASMSNDEALGLLESISRLEFDTIQQEFNLIAEDYPKIDVFIEYDKEATKIWSEFQTIQDIPNPIEKRQKFLKIKKQLGDYTISVPKNFKELVGYMESIDMGYLSKTIIQQTGIYNKQVGLVKEHVTDTFFT